MYILALSSGISENYYKFYSGDSSLIELKNLVGNLFSKVKSVVPLIKPTLFSSIYFLWIGTSFDTISHSCSISVIVQVLGHQSKQSGSLVY